MFRLTPRLIVLSIVLAGAVPAGAAARAAADVRVNDAIVAAVRERLGADAEVVVDSLEIFTPAGTAPDARVDAMLDPAARLGDIVRFTLTVNGARTGHADARLRVVVEHARAVRFVPRGALLAAGDVEDVTDELVNGPLRHLPRASDVAGGRALRDLAAGVAIAESSIAMLPVVRSGQTVTAISHAFGIEAAATMVAAESGNAGAVIRVVNRTTRKALRARIVSAEVVEIIHD
jgi:flagella basal body P-ring formation protein FlgA